MKRGFGWAMMAVAALGLAACDKKSAQQPTASQSAGPVAVAPGGDWTTAVSETPEGGFRMGNPDAPVKLIEYASLTCPHCRDFSRSAATALRETYVKSGKLSWEFRSFPLNPIDVAATLLATCQGAGPVFPLIEQSYAEQEKWVLPYQKLSDADQAKIQALPQDRQFLALAQAGGLDAFYRVRGLPAAKAEACLLDKAKVTRIVAVRDRGINEDKVEGTPTFLINGVKVDEPPVWTALEPLLKKAIG